VDEYFKPRWTFLLLGLCEPFEVAPWSFLLTYPSLGSVCCGGALAEARPTVASSEVSYGVSVGQEGSYNVFKEPF
jgi:hypothetical protein